MGKAIVVIMKSAAIISKVCAVSITVLGIVKSVSDAISGTADFNPGFMQH